MILMVIVHARMLHKVSFVPFPNVIINTHLLTLESVSNWMTNNIDILEIAVDIVREDEK